MSFTRRTLTYIIGVLSSIALIYISRGFWLLLKGERLAVDLALRWWRYQKLFVENENIYSTISDAVYAPSSYFFLGPFMGLFSYNYADMAWAIVNLMSLLISSFIIYKWVTERNNDTLIGFTAISAFLSMHSISMGLGIGQISVFYLTLFLITVYMGLNRPFGDAVNYIIGSAALAIGLGKYSLVAPLCLVLLFHKRLRNYLITAVLINILVSWYIASSMGESLYSIILHILENSKQVLSLGSIDVHSLMYHLEVLPDYSSIVSISILLLLLLYLFKVSNSCSIFGCLALAAIVTRFWTYHGHYDNVVFVFLLIYLFRQIKWETLKSWKDLYALDVIWLIGIWVSLVIPSRILSVDPPYLGIFLFYQVFVWLGSATILVGKRCRNTQEKIN